MTEGKRKAGRILAVEQAAMVWAMIDDDTSEEHIAEFIESGQMEAAPDVLPYSPDVMAEIAKQWN